MSELRQSGALLERAGYAPAQQASHFPVWLQEREVLHVKLVAFGRSSPHDMTTATVVCGLPDSSGRPPSILLRAARVLAAPLVLTQSRDTVDLWPAVPADEPIIQHVPFESSDAKVFQLLRPEHLLAAKVGHRQLPLFPVPVDLLQAARRDRATKLEPLIQAAFSTAVDHYGAVEEDPETVHKKAARIVVGALTTLTIRDKHELRSIGHNELLQRVQNQFPRNFDWLAKTRSLDRRLLNALLDELGNWVDYSSLDATILSEVYESALVRDEERASLGIHYTPPGVARRLLAELPVEILPPEQRHVVDPACGSGTLLVAAHDRLRRLQPSTWPEEVRHQDLQVHLRGYDKDPFAAEIARLALLLNAMPAGNGWQIDTADSLKDDGVKSSRPSIVVANPPWKHTRTGGHVTELADAFVTLICDLVAPGGLFALLLPASWLSSRASSASRELIQQRSQIFEVWRLPPHTFPTSNARSIAVLGQRKMDGVEGTIRSARLIRVIRPGELDKFTADGQASETYAIPKAPSQTEEHLASPLSLTIEETALRLGDIATVLSGPQPRGGIQPKRGKTRYLDNFGLIPPYYALDRSQTWGVNYPEDFVGAWAADLIDRKKVLVSAIRYSDTPWCVKSVMDPLGVAVRNSAQMVAPKEDDEDAVYALFAFTASGFFNCWIDEQAVGVNIPTRATRSVPIPYGDGFVDAFAEVGRAMLDATSLGEGDELPEILRSLEKIVWKGLKSAPLAHRICANRLAGWPAPEGAIRYKRRTPQRQPIESLGQRRFGYVMEVLGEGLRLWINGLTPEEGTLVETPQRMPGWLLRSGATFDVEEYDSGLENAKYSLQSHSHEDFDTSLDSVAR